VKDSKKHGGGKARVGGVGKTKICNMSLDPIEMDYTDLRDLSFKPLATKFLMDAPASQKAAGTSTWVSTSSGRVIVVEFDWFIRAGAHDPECSDINGIRSNLIPIRCDDAWSEQLTDEEAQLCIATIVMAWINWEEKVLQDHAMRAIDPEVVALFRSQPEPNPFWDESERRRELETLPVMPSFSAERLSRQLMAMF